MKLALRNCAQAAALARTHLGQEQGIGFLRRRLPGRRALGYRRLGDPRVRPGMDKWGPAMAAGGSMDGMNLEEFEIDSLLLGSREISAVS
jgi:hypothetical protein